ncbi:MAG: Phosphoglycerate mutase [Frankiales bacterium]|nr:Phosphoglycerate mutase [Frankiales bacterium]
MLLRHGRTAHNAGGVIQGQTDVPLDDVGRTQAQQAAEVLAAAAPDVVVTSDLARARDTAQAVADRTGAVLRVDPRLRELFLGAWQGLTSEQARERFPDEHAAWRRGQDVARGGGETYADAGRRALACLEELLPEVPAGGTLLAVTHGGTARAAVAALLGLDRDTAWRLAPLGNTCWSVLVEAERGWRLERHNAGLGPLVGPATGGHDLGDDVRPAPGVARATDL